MDKKNIERPQKFDKRSYNDAYQKEHYNSFSARLKPELFARVDDYCKDHKISKADFVRIAIDTLEDMER